MPPDAFLVHRCSPALPATDGDALFDHYRHTFDALTGRILCVFQKATPSRTQVMPEISRFLGIVITMYFNDHNPPHFHVR